MTPEEQKDQADTAKKELKAEKRKTRRLMSQNEKLKIDSELMKNNEVERMVQLAKLVTENREQAQQLEDVSNSFPAAHEIQLQVREPVRCQFD